MSRTAVQRVVVDRFDTFLAELRRTLGDSIDQFACPSPAGPVPAELAGPLSVALREDWRHWMQAWREEKLQEAQQGLLDGLLAAVDRLHGQDLFETGGCEDSLANDPLQNSDALTGGADLGHKSASAPAVDDEQTGPDRSSSGNGQGAAHPSSPGNGCQRASMVKQRSVVAFLTAHDFEYEANGRGEAAYRHVPSGQRISISPHHSNGQEIGRGLLKKLRQRLHRILGVQIGVRRGQLVCLDNEDHGTTATGA